MHAQAKDDTSHDHMRASCVEVPAGATVGTVKSWLLQVPAGAKRSSLSQQISGPRFPRRHLDTTGAHMIMGGIVFRLRVHSRQQH